jgi:tetratricopeptide (TPR) repeat protein
MKKISMLVLSLVLTTAGFITSRAQSPESNPSTYQAYLNRSASDALKAWEDEVSAAESGVKASANDDTKFRLALAHYGLLNSTMRSMDETTFKKYADNAVTNLESIKDKHAGEAMAVLAAVHGLQMAYDQSKGMYLGPRSSALLSKARKTDPSSPLVWRLYGNSMMHTPEAYGGDVAEAITAYEKSLALYEAAPDRIKNNWMYIDTMAFLGQAYVKNNEPSKAIKVYEKALTVEPAYGWIKYNLLPGAQAKAK